MVSALHSAIKSSNRGRSAEFAGRQFGEVLASVLCAVAKQKAAGKLSSGINFDPEGLMRRWPPGLYRALFTAVCPNEWAVQPATLRTKGLRVLAALEVLAYARSQKHHILQQFLSDVRTINLLMWGADKKDL